MRANILVVFGIHFEPSLASATIFVLISRIRHRNICLPEPAAPWQSSEFRGFLKFMLKYIVTALFFSAAAIVQGETVTLGTHGSLEIQVPSGWKLERSETGSVGCNLMLVPTSDANARCLVSVMYPPKAEVLTHEKLRSQLTAVCQRFASASVEHKVEIREYSLPTGYGVYATFTDADLVGKPAQRDNFKVINPGLIQFSPEVMATVTIFTDDANGPEQKALVNIISGLDFKPAK